MILKVNQKWAESGSEVDRKWIGRDRKWIGSGSEVDWKWIGNGWATYGERTERLNLIARRVMFHEEKANINNEWGQL